MEPVNLDIEKELSSFMVRYVMSADLIKIHQSWKHIIETITTTTTKSRTLGYFVVTVMVKST